MRADILKNACYYLSLKLKNYRLLPGLPSIYLNTNPFCSLQLKLGKKSVSGYRLEK